jgi:hypothetical protein
MLIRELKEVYNALAHQGAQNVHALSSDKDHVCRDQKGKQAVVDIGRHNSCEHLSIRI